MAARRQSMAATTFSDKKGSIRLASLPVSISRPGTPFFPPSEHKLGKAAFFLFSEKGSHHGAVFYIRDVKLLCRLFHKTDAARVERRP